MENAEPGFQLPKHHQDYVDEANELEIIETLTPEQHNNVHKLISDTAEQDLADGLSDESEEGKVRQSIIAHHIEICDGCRNKIMSLEQ